MRNSRVDVVVAVPLARQLDVLRAARRPGPGRGRSSTAGARPWRPARGCGPAPAPVEQRPGRAAARRTGRRRRRPAGAAAPGGWTAAPGPPAPGRPPSRGARAACMAAIRPPIELPTRIAGGPATSVRKRCSSCWLASTDVGSAAALGAPEAGQVEGEHAAGRGEQRGQRRPVDQRAAEPVHADEQRAVGRAAVVDVVHPAAEVGPPRLRPGERVPRARRARAVGGSAGVPCAWLMRRP